MQSGSSDNPENHYTLKLFLNRTFLPGSGLMIISNASFFNTHINFIDKDLEKKGGRFIPRLFCGRDRDICLELE